MINKFQKFLIFFSSLLVLAVIVMLLKLQGDNKKLLKIEEGLQNYLKSQAADTKKEATITDNEKPNNETNSKADTIPSQPAVQPVIPEPIVINPAPAKTAPASSKQTKTS